MRKLRAIRILVRSVAATLFVATFSVAIAAASSGTISHSYKSLVSIPRGSLVSIDPDHKGFIVLSNVSNGNQLLGVAVGNNESLITVDATSNTTQVATTGVIEALVSTVNGPIAVGDQIGVSPFNGIGMKASPGQRVIGLAQADFNSNTKNATTQSVTDKSGKSKDIVTGTLRISVSIGTATIPANQGRLQRLADSIAGHPVSKLRVILCSVIATVTLIALITLIYASIYSSIISIGRNPLAKFAIYRTLISVMGMVFLTAAVAVFTIFLILR